MITRDQVSQLKGIGALAVIACHVGYFIFGAQKFLFPFSNYGSVAVDLFYFLSAYGLVVASAAEMPLKEFYQKRLIRLAPPIWVTLAIFFLLDFLVYGKIYGVGYALLSFLLIFPTADLFSDVNSPLWYITPLVFYYLFFPLLYKKGRPLVSACGFLLFGFALSRLSFIDLHFRLHYLAFPLGLLFATYGERMMVTILQKPAVRWAGAFVLPILFILGSLYLGRGTWVEPYLTAVLMLCFVGLFLILSLSLPIFSLLGTYSFELYLLHWPLMSRFDFLYFLKGNPWVWLLVWLVIFLGLSALTRRLCSH